jgi:SMC interacting uncharacterized protein involved in chromosome segregation
MTSVEKMTISISKAAVVLVFIVGLVINYLTTLNAVKSGIQEVKSETQIEINNLKNADKNLQSDIQNVKQDLGELKMAATSYIGKAIMPRETKYEEEKRR